MDEKTERLRDIFLSVSEDETVTESQESGRGSLSSDDGAVEERLQAVIADLDELFERQSSLSAETRSELVRLFYAGRADDEIAERLECSPETVFRARMELHLVRDSDCPDDVEASIRNASQGDTLSADESRLSAADASGLARQLDTDPETVSRCIATIAAQKRSVRVSHRFRTAFEEILTDADLSVQFAVDAHRDGLDDATDGAEVDVDF